MRVGESISVRMCARALVCAWLSTWVGVGFVCVCVGMGRGLLLVLCSAWFGVMSACVKSISVIVWVFGTDLPAGPWRGASVSAGTMPQKPLLRPKRVAEPPADPNRTELPVKAEHLGGRGGEAADKNA